jgi:hypothetical protein
MEGFQMVNRLILSSSIAVALCATAPAAVIYSTDFETNQSASWTVVGDDAGAANDFSANFAYDYSTYAPTAPDTTPASIPAAPSGAGTKGLRLDANHADATAAAAAVTAYVNAASGLSQYTLKFDLFVNYNGPSGGGSGSTEFITVGGNATNSSVTDSAWPTFTGFWWTMTGEGGAAQDYRYYEGTGAAPVRTDTIPNWNGANELDQGSAGWQALFPSPAYETPGAPGKAWVVVEEVVNNSVVTVFLTPTGGVKTQVASWTLTAGVPNSGFPLVGYWDAFSSIANPIQDNFAVIDNLSITTPAASVEDFNLY